MVSENPYLKPIQTHWRRLQSIRWMPPFLPQAVISLALLLVLALLYGLYATIGIAAQISAMCLQLLSDARQQIQSAAPVEKSAYLVAALVYTLVFLPFWLLQLPILFLGWVSHRLAEMPHRTFVRRLTPERREYVAPRFSEARR